MNKMMMKALTGAVLFIVLIPLGLTAQDEGFYPYSFARLSYVSGSVYVQRTSDLGFEKGEVNLALVQGDKMGTESGQAEVHFGRRNYLRIDNNTKPCSYAKLMTRPNGDQIAVLQWNAMRFWEEDDIIVLRVRDGLADRRLGIGGAGVVGRLLADLAQHLHGPRDVRRCRRLKQGHPGFPSPFWPPPAL